jgi:hypothetical protein
VCDVADDVNETARLLREKAAARATLFPPRALMKIRGAQIMFAKVDERRVEYGRIDLLLSKELSLSSVMTRLAPRIATP